MSVTKSGKAVLCIFSDYCQFPFQGLFVFFSFNTFDLLTLPLSSSITHSFPRYPCLCTYFLTVPVFFFTVLLPFYGLLVFFFCLFPYLCHSFYSYFYVLGPVTVFPYLYFSSCQCLCHFSISCP